MILPQEKTESDVKVQENPSRASGDSLHFPCVQALGGLSHKVQQTDDPSQENPDEASSERLHVPGSTRNPDVTEPEASYLEGVFTGCQNASSSSGRMESQNPYVQASGDRLQSKGDGEVTTLLSPGVKLLLNPVARVEENLKKPSENKIGQTSVSTLQRGVLSHAIACGQHSK